MKCSKCGRVIQPWELYWERTILTKNGFGKGGQVCLTCKPKDGKSTKTK